MAARGLKPVVEIQFFDYIWPAMMQIRNEMAMLRYRSGNHWSCPMVIRVPIGGYLRGGGPYHSQSGESIFAHCPGIRIAYPSNAVDAAGLLRTAIRCDDPVMFLEHKGLYATSCDVPADPRAIPFGEAALKRAGSDLTLVTLGAMVNVCERAAASLAADGIECDVIDLRTTSPLDTETVLESVAMTGRLIVVDEAPPRCGIAADIAALVAEQGFATLRSPVVQVTAPHTPMPFTPPLEKLYVPSVERVIAAARRTCRAGQSTAAAVQGPA
jgi:pyruvate/2-oxoglutarate/acetoin dehydrogenase E1 component